ncbi:hypothetical protein GIB67_032427 [Kingdonia uniflora]|uniref:BHLH domain-containing protein n=1 Tax=Kingdonia uniflora TaxID=39325 RepID=A0A7J7MIR1_9MAGN|nr:hypothetical protein GIB67_032427 [Kingdonia uniflora]
MCEEMGLTQLQLTLRSLCLGTEWKYAVFWKLKHRARMVLSWEDSYYNNHESSDHPHHMCFHDTPKILQDGLQDPLGLAVAKMSYLEYSIGEGIVGQVAVSGKHQWIFANKLVSCSRSSSEKYSDGWHTQFSAGVKTIAVVAVVPHGVIQLGSLNTVNEDIKLVTRIKHLFYLLQQSSMELIPNPIQFATYSTLCELEVSATGSPPEVLDGFLHGLDEAVEVGSGHLGLEPSTIVNDVSPEIVQLEYEIPNVECQKDVLMKLQNKRKYRESYSICKDRNVCSKQNDAAPYNFPRKNTDFDSCIIPVEQSVVDHHCMRSELLDFAIRVDNVKNEKLGLPEPLEIEFGKNLEQKSDTGISCIDNVNTCFIFSAGCELHEALGPAFKKAKDCAWSDSEKTETGVLVDHPEFVSESLLEAVLMSACTGSTFTNVLNESSLSKPAESLLTTGNTPHPQLKPFWDLTEVCNRVSLEGSSSKTLSTCSKQLEVQVESPKTNKKKARPGESCRPRPRDRQLIQDRIKDLRELIPNGLKCSIDSLLERTIKHMSFLQDVIKHDDMLNKCAESKVSNKRMGSLGFYSHEHGSSWALEVGSQTKSCPIVVENFNRNGQMLIEMVCEEYCNFLEIAEVIRSLGLVILKGVTKSRGEKTWACFVIEVWCLINWQLAF